MLQPCRPLGKPRLEEIEPHDGKDPAGHDEENVGQARWQSDPCVYRRREEDLPARKPEIERVKEKGSEFVMCANPVRVIGEQVMTGVGFVKMAMCAIDDTGRPEPEPIDESHFTIDADVFIEAIGQGPNPLLISELAGIVRSKRGNVIVDEDCRTALRHVFAGGDVATGAATVIQAMGAAKKAARAIDRMLSEEQI
jgi:glutamate synthase (NADPH/NADH) small chain